MTENPDNRFVEPGAIVQEFDKICEVQSDKASVEISSRYAGNVVKLHYGKHDVAKVGHPLVDIETDEEDTSDANAASTSNSSPSVSVDNAKLALSSINYKINWVTPAVRRLLNEYGLKVEDVTGSGKNGMLLKGDVLKQIKLDSLKKGTETCYFLKRILKLIFLFKLKREAMPR